MLKPVASFTGRKGELEEIHNELQKSVNEQAEVSQIVVIGGLGGIGKSELARKYACSYEEYYDNNAVWIDAETQSSIKKTFEKLVVEEINRKSPKNSQIPLTIEIGGRQEEREITYIAKDIYEYFKDANSLFIFDNVEKYKDISKFLPSSLSTKYKKPYILITSRDKDWEVRKKGKIEVIELGVLDEVEAIEFVKKSLNIDNISQDEEIERLAEELQYFPLALEQAVVYIHNKNKESELRGYGRFYICDYLTEYQQQAKKLLKEGVCQNEDRYTETVLTTWDITITYIQKEYASNNGLPCS